MESRALCEYIWLDNEMRFRSKIRVLPKHKVIPQWNFDGSSTNQIVIDTTHSKTTVNTELVLNPVYTCNNPLQKDTTISSYLVLCDVYNIDGTPHSSNTRFKANQIFDTYASHNPWFGLEQEYFICKNNDNNTWRKNVSKTPMTPLFYDSETTLPLPIYYCSQGNHYGRQIMEEHLNACIKARMTVSGTNAEVVPAQWEFQIGPTTGIEASDMLVISRFLLERIADNHGCSIEFHPKPLASWNGSGCHVNFSTENMRNKNGIEYIYEAIEKLKVKHDEHLTIFGQDNHLRLVGECEAPSVSEFTWGIGTRTTSIRIGKETFDEQCGYFEDRRPASNIDPYLVTSSICETVCE